MKRRVGGAAAALAASVVVTAPMPAPADAGVAVVQINGKGFGHGVGMAQDGELAMGQAGSSTDQILGQFYPGTSLTQAGGQIRVVVLGARPASTVLAFPNGGQVQDAQSGAQSAGFPLRVPAGDAVTVSLANGTYTASVSGSVGVQAASPAVTLPGPPGSSTTTTRPSGSTTTTSPRRTTTTTSPLARLTPSTTSTTVAIAPTTTSTTLPGQGGGGSTTSTTPAPSARASSSRPLWLIPNSGNTTYVASTGRRYRGVVETVGANGGAELDLVNQLNVETYLRGMGEVQDPSWPPASLQAQAIIERTYALRAMQSAAQICDDTRCQVYLGAQAEYAAQDKAVSSTAGQVLSYGGSLAATVFSANGGAYTATPQEGFGPGAGDYPYLRAAPYRTTNPFPWSLQVAFADVASRVGYPGNLTSVAVATTGPSGRALTVALLGSAGAASVPGVTFAADLGLRSTLFQLLDTTATTAPAAPPPADTGQALPTDAAALEAAASTPVAVAAPAGRSAVGAGSSAHRGHSTSGRSLTRWSWPAVLLILVISALVLRNGRSYRRS